MPHNSLKIWLNDSIKLTHLVYYIQISFAYPSNLGCILLEKVQVAFNFKRWNCIQMVLFSPMLKFYFTLSSELNINGSNYLRKNEESNMWFWMPVPEVPLPIQQFAGWVERFHALFSWNFTPARYMTKETRKKYWILAPHPLVSVNPILTMSI